MSDLPQNELFSAYLDGELSAAEQAEMERLLATSPAARQLLDELRALSTTLQSLPQQKVGEDLSQRVLRVAERRMLAGEESGPPELPSEPPVPLARSVFRRFATPRILVRLALIAAVALIVVINDWSHRAQQSREAGREVAIALAAAEKRTELRDNAPMSIQAAPEPPRETTKGAESPVAGKPAAAPAEALSKLSANRPVSQSPKEPARKDVALGGAEMKALPDAERDAASPAAALPPAEAPAAARSNKIVRNMNLSTSGGPAPEDASREFGGSVNGYSGGAAGAAKQAAGGTDNSQNRRAEQDAKSAEVGENMLVVRCDMSPEAAEKGAFDKLLSANGIAWQEGGDQTVQGGQVQQLDKKTAAADETSNKEKTADDEKTEPALTSQVDLVYVEATPAQVTATLAGLSAQPEAFPSVSIQPSQDKAAGGTNWQEVVRQQVGNYQSLGASGNVILNQASPARSSAQPATESAKVEVPEENRKALALSSMANQARAQRIQLLDRGSQNLEQRQSGAALRESAVQSAGENLARSMAAAATNQRQLQTPKRAQIEQSAQSRAQQQVLFVLHVVGGKQSAIPPAKGQKAAVESNAAKPAKPTAKPAVKPADEK